MADRLEFTTLLDWVEGRLDAERSRQVSAVVAAGDPETRETVEWIRDFIGGARQMPLHAPPPELSRRLHRLFHDHVLGGGQSGWSDATLLHDDRLPGAAAGMRDGGARQRLRLVFGSELGRFVLEASPAAPGEVDLEGVVIPEAEGLPLQLSFLEAGALRRALTPTSSHRFAVEGMPVAVDEVWLTQGERRVRARLDLRIR